VGKGGEKKEAGVLEMLIVPYYAKVSGKKGKKKKKAKKKKKKKAPVAPLLSPGPLRGGKKRKGGGTTKKEKKRRGKGSRPKVSPSFHSLDRLGTFNKGGEESGKKKEGNRGGIIFFTPT